MEHIIEELYNLFPPEESFSPEERQKIRDELFPMYDQVRAALGFAFMDRLTQLRSDMGWLDELNAFRQGLRLGAQLTLEVLSP